MKNYIRILVYTISVLLIINSCGEETSPEVKTVLYQIPGCKGNSLSKSFNAQLDSCFHYSFAEKLEIEFCVSGNCCPDENRFVTTSKIVNDSIIIAVRDTAQHLCRCICNYIIHGEFESLPLNKYIVKCIMNTENKNDVLYLMEVKK